MAIHFPDLIMKTLTFVFSALLIIPLISWSADADMAVDRVIAAHWAWQLEQRPEWRLDYGDRSGNALWTDASLDALAARQQARDRFVRQLSAIEPATLSADATLNRSMLLREIRDDMAAHELGLNLMSINMRSGPQHRYGMVEYLPFDTTQDYEDWLTRLESLPTQLAQYQAQLAEGIARQRTQARIVMARVPDQIDRVITDDPEQSPFWQPFATIPDSISAATQTAIRDRARAIIQEQLNPAYAEFKSFMVGHYLPACREAPGIGSLPGGKDIYRELVKQFTTTDLSPEQVHEIGLREVARIRSEMMEIIDEVGFEGDLQAFNNFLRSDPQFYYSDADTLLTAYQAISKRIDPELVKLFGKIPRMPYGVRAIPDEIAPDTTTAYYMGPAADGSRAGFYYVNLYRPEVRPKYEMEVLSVHEAVPGHHLQIALAQELTDLPNFRRDSNVTAFVEGWGLYSERLGYDLGLYQDPYSRYGQLIYDMWRAVRLVVDTGIHYFGWERQRAIDYFLANAAKTEADIINEIDRYIGWPGQALAYKIGQMKMLELRSEAEAALGENFDIRAFHDTLLGAGAIPLDALEARMDKWLSEQLSLVQ